jgi:hypothetical protein
MDFGPGWRIVACKDFHNTDSKGAVQAVPFGAFWAIKTIE